MRALRILAVSIASILTFVLAPRDVQAITVPDSGTCTTGGVCLQITDQNAGITLSGLSQDLTNSASVGVDGEAGQGIGVKGYSTYNNAVYGVSAHADGVHGESGYSPGNNGVSGSCNNGSGSGVYGYSGANGYGVAGRAPGGIAVYGDNANASGWSGYFTGKVFAQSGYFSGSDARLKKDVRDLVYDADTLAKLRAVSYRWKSTGDDQAHIGLIAQEVQKIIPEIVRADVRNGMLSIDYVELVPLLIKVVQRQESRIDELEREHAPIRSAMFSLPDIPAGVALALLPLGLFIAIRRRRGPLP